MKLPRRTLLRFAAASVAAPAFSHVATAQTYPSRATTMIIPYPAGGPTDTIARLLAEQIGSSLGQPIIIENVSGAEGSIGTGRVARAKPDGYTIELGTTSTHMLNGALYSLSYDVLIDFMPISALAATPPLFKEDDAGKGLGRTHRLAESQSQQSVDRS
jgi:tripartite-type tricarboxylate transporter receptor subunit TctC